MAKRGRSSKASQEQILKQDAGKIAKRFLSYPLREPVGPLFDPYYQRILKGDLAAVLDYCESNCGTFFLDASFYELIGRLLFLQHHFAAAKQIVAEIARRLVHLTGPPDNVDEEYGHWYCWLRILSKLARQFIRERYKADESVKREQLWHEYIERHYVT